MSKPRFTVDDEPFMDAIVILEFDSDYCEVGFTDDGEDDDGTANARERAEAIAKLFNKYEEELP